MSNAFQETVQAFIIAQVLGVIIIIVCALIPHMRTKTRMLLWYIVVNVLQILQFWLLAARTGMLTIIAMAIRSIVLFAFSKNGKRAPVWVLLVLITLHLSAGIVAWEDWRSIFMMMAVVNVYALWQENLTIVRIAAIITSIGIGMYSLLSGAYTGAVNECIIIVSASLSLWRYRSLNQAGFRSQPPDPPPPVEE